MNQRDFDVDLKQVFSVLDIGSPIGSPTSVHGGLLHRMWRVETESGTFAVKVLNPEIMSRPDAKRNFRNSERVARIARNNGICTVTARTVGNDPWLESDGSYVMVFDWIDGRMLPPEECTLKHAMKIGEVLFQIHRLNIVLDDVKPSIWSGIPEDTWKVHINDAHESVSCWQFDSATLLNDVINWSRLHQDASKKLAQRMIMSHGDLDAKNVLWDNTQSPYVIDWESAGYLNPTVELIEVAMNWSRNKDGTSDRTRFQALVRSYLQAGGTLSGDALDALYGSMGGMLGWLEYNMRRSVDNEVFSRDERHLAQKEVKQTVHQLTQFVHLIFDYAKWFEEILG